jgi:dipeptidyl-peptidase-4
MKTKLWFPIFLITFLFSTFVQAQEKHLSMEDAVLGYYKGLYPKRVNGLNWVKDADNFVLSEKESFVIKSSDNIVLNTIFLSDIQTAFSSVKSLPRIEFINPSDLVFRTKESFNIYNYNLKTKVAAIAFDKKAQNQDFCYKNKAVAYTIDNNLYIATQSETKKAITEIKDKNRVSGQAIHRYEFGISKGTFWSPKGTYLAFYQKDETNVTDYPIVDMTTYPASLKASKYPMAGQGSEKAKIGVYQMSNHKLVYLDIDTSDEHYLTNLSWSPDEKYVLLAEVNRKQNHMWFTYYDALTGKKVKTIFEEKNEKWVEPETPALFLPNSNSKFLWLSERDGFMNVYQYNLYGSDVKQITNFDFVLTKILGFDKKAKNLFVEATGNDPKELQVFKVNLSSLKVKQITKDGGTHRTQLSESGDYLIDNFTSLTTPRKVGIINTQSKSKDCQVLLEAENPLKEWAIGKTEFVKLKAIDGTPLEARIIKPANFDTNKKYPVLIYVYGGPHAQLVTDTWMGGASLWMHYLVAEKDYIVFTVDGRGSAHRGFKFESSIHRKQGVVNMEDQMTGVNYLKSLPYVDAKRLAIHGWSYGGFMTISMLLHHSDVFTTGVAGGPVTDWKYYEVMYGERYMDMPDENPEGYKNSRVHNYIENLKADLLIIHGSIDDTVVPQHSMTLLKEAVEKGVQLDFFTYPMHPHNVRGKDRVHLMTKVVNYILDKNK